MNKKLSALICSTALLLSLHSFSQTVPVLIGTSSAGGAGGYGTVFYVNTGASTVLQTTNVPGGGQGANPYGSITKGNNGKFYGMTYNGGANNVGAIYEVNYTGPYTIKVSFAAASNGSYPNGAFCAANDGFLYGLTRQGGANGYGCIMRYGPGAFVTGTLHHFNSGDGVYPNGSLIQGADGKLYGLTSSGGSFGNGTLFSYDFGTFTYTVLHHFNSSIDGGAPKGSLFQASNGKLYGMTNSGGLSGFGTIFEYNIAVPTFTVLHHFNGSVSGSAPEGDLIEGDPGLLYGMTKSGGSFNYGTIFEYTIGGGLVNKFNFQNSVSDGGQPQGTLIRSGYNNLFYGVTGTGGGSNAGVLFEFDPSGSVYTKKIDFNAATNGSNPQFIKLFEYLPLDASINGINPSCFGFCDGSATVTPTGGTAPYTYSWAPSGGTSATATGLCSGSYTCTITEAGGYQIQKSVSVFNPTPLSITNLSTTDVSCNGMANGSISNNVGSGGTPGYTYDWTPGNPTGDGTTNVTGLTAGSWTCTVTDANGCTSSLITNITQPSAINSSIASQSNVSCFGGGNGFVSVSAGGGTGGFTYLWSPSGGTTTTLSPASAGNYTLTITDANACTHIQPVTVTEPSAVNVSLIVSDAVCNGSMTGSISATGSGGTGGYTYLWTPGGMTTTIVSGLGAGTYTCDIVDANGCTSNSTGTVLEPSAIVSSASGTDVLCNGGSDGTAVNNPTGGTPPYTYLWSPSGQTTQTAIGLSAGNHFVTITDANGCTANDLSAVGEPAPLSASTSQSATGCQGSNAGEAYILVTGGTGPYSYLWNSGGTSDVEPGLAPGTYTCNVTDNNGCTISDSHTIAENPNTDVTGNITAPTLNINNGFVYAFKQQASINGIDTVAITPIIPGSPNTYTFSGLQADNYYIKVVPDQTTFPTAVPTYFGDEFQWDSSLVVMHGCSVIDVADINVIELNSGSGTGFISGFVIEGEGFGGLRINNNGGNPNMPFAPGGPLKGVDIKLGKNPGGGIQARTMSDSTGYYNFIDVPDGDYTIYVDIPNLPMDSTRNVVLSSGADTSIQNNYYADSLMIFIDTAQSIGIYSSEKIYENKFSVYPNPSKGIMNIFFVTEKENSLITFEITNSLGQLMKTVKQKQYVKGDHTLTLDVQQMNMKAGVYFISIINEARKYTQRLVVVE